MFRRSNKITALLVAAASVMTMVPAMAADNSRLGNKNGTVKQGIAYDGGKYAYYGYRDDSTDDTGIYYNKGGEAKDSGNSDLEDYRFNSDSKYGTKYAYAKEKSNDDEYLVDLSTGDIVTDDTAEEKRDSAQAKLVAKIKKADRYKNVITTTDDLNGRFDQILKGQFGDIWYQYDTSVAASVTGTVKGEVAVTADTNWSTLKVGDKTFAKTDSTPVAGFTTPADFAAKAATSTFTGYTVTGVDSTTGTVTLTQTTASNFTQADADALTNNINANLKVVTPGVAGAGATTAATGTATTYTYTGTAALLLTSGGTAVTAANAPAVVGYTASVSGNSVVYTEDPDSSGIYRGAAFNGPTLYDGTTAKAASSATKAAGTVGHDATTGTAAVKAVVQVTPVDFSKSVKILGTTFYKNAAVAAGFKDAAGFKTQLLAAAANGDLGNYQIKDNAVTVDGAKVTFTLVQKEAQNLNQSNIDFSADGVTAVVTKNGVGGTANAAEAGFTGFCDENGTYIDASYYANMRIYSQSKGRAITVEKYDDEVNDAGLAVHLDKLNAIAQDKDNIYAIAEVTVSGDGLGSAPAKQYFLQQISKAQGEKENGAYTPKSIKSYQLQDPDSQIYDDDDMSDAWKAINGTKDDDYSTYLLGMQVIDGSLYVTRAKDSRDKVRVYKIDMKNAKDDVVVNGATLTKDVDTYALKLDDSKETDIVEVEDRTSVDDEGIQGIEKIKDLTDETKDVQLDGFDLYRHPAVSIDVNGNTWALDKGQIKKYTKLDVKDVNTCDRAMDAIDAYDDNSVIAWDTDGDAYTTIQEGKKQTEDDGINVNPDINKDKFKNGYDATEKKFYKDGKVVTNDWAADNGKWYLLDANGTALTGWQQKGAWYLLGADGAMLTGWQQNGGNWYYLNPVNSAGNMVTGWFQDTTGNWYYTDASGKMLSNTVVDGYTLGASGAWVK